jgi:hypothetical protein
MNELSVFTNKNLKRQVQTLRNYAKAKYNILCFDKQGKILCNIIQKTDLMGQGKVTFNGNKAPFIEEYIRSMKKD